MLVPTKLQDKLLEELHQDHPGMSRMKAVAKSYMWWPGLDKSIENKARSCSLCQAVRHQPPVAPLHPWCWPEKPWQHIHVDFAGPFQGTMFLVTVDAHSKWPEVSMMSFTTVSKTMDVLRQMFAAYGLPDQIVSDNGPQFISDDFAMLTKMSGIKHIRSAPYHPASDGLAERFVQSLKQALKASLKDGRPLFQRLQSFLLKYGMTPHTTTGVTPSSLFLHRHIRTRLDLLKPSCDSHVFTKQGQQKTAHDLHAKSREWFVCQSVMAKNFRPGPDWISGIIIEKLGPLSYLVETSAQQVWRRHMD